LSSVLFYVGTDRFKSVVEHLGGSTAFCVAIFQFASRAEEGGRRGGGFTDKDRFEGGNPGEREEIGFEGNPATGISGRTA
jgi:hypothetical protein